MHHITVISHHCLFVFCLLLYISCKACSVVYLTADSFSNSFQLAWPPGRTLSTSLPGLSKTTPTTSLVIPFKTKPVISF